MSILWETDAQTEDTSTSKLATLVLAISLFCLIVLSSSCSVYRSVFSPELKQTICGSLRVSSEWTEINLSKPFKPKREENAVMFDFATALNEKDVVTGNDVSKWGIRFPDGTVALPEVNLVDQDGSVYPLTIDFFDTKLVGFRMIDARTHLENLPRDKVFRAVRVRCARDISFSKVYWYSFNQYDRK